MPKNKNKGKKKTGASDKKSGKNLGNPSPNAITYLGPLVTKLDKLESDHTAMLLTTVTSVSSTAGGVINLSFGNDDVANAGDWASIIAVWGETRCLVHEIIWVPANKYNKTATVCTPGIACTARDNLTAIVSLSAAADHSSAKFVTLEDKWSIKINMQGTDEAVWDPSGAVIGRTWCKFFFTGLTVSTLYGSVFHRVRVQMRGRK